MHKQQVFQQAGEMIKLHSNTSRKKSLFEQSEHFFQNNLVSTLLKPPKDRTKNEINVLVTLALSRKNVNGQQTFFEKFVAENGEANLRELLKSCYYE